MGQQDEGYLAALTPDHGLEELEGNELPNPRNSTSYPLHLSPKLAQQIVFAK